MSANSRLTRSQQRQRRTDRVGGGGRKMAPQMIQRDARAQAGDGATEASAETAQALEPRI